MMLFSDVKNHKLFQEIETFFGDVDFYNRKLPLMKMLLIITNVPVSSKWELFIKTGEIERKLDHYFTDVYKGEKLQKEEVDYLKCCIDIITEYENNPFSIDQFITILKSFVPQKQTIFKSISFLSNDY